MYVFRLMVPADNSSGRSCRCVDHGTHESADRGIAPGAGLRVRDLRSGQARLRWIRPGLAKALPRYTCLTTPGWLRISWAFEHWRFLKLLMLPLILRGHFHTIIAYVKAHSLLSISPNMDQSEIVSVS